VTLKGKIFEAEKDEIRAKWPWYQLGQGVRLKVAGKTYWFAWIGGSAPPRARRRAIDELLLTLSPGERVSFYLAKAKTWRRYLKT
jgi:hypothetical protein